MSMQIESVPVSDLKEYEKNSRTHSDDQVAKIAASVEEFGFTNPILIDESNVVIAGHGRLQAAKRINMGEVPCIRLAHLSESQKRAYVIADNKIAESGGWDDEMLKMEIMELAQDDYDLKLTGFDEAGLDSILAISEEVMEAVQKKRDHKETGHSQQDTVRQVILIYTSDEYPRVMEAMREYAEEHGLSSNTEVVNHLLENAPSKDRKKED